MTGYAVGAALGRWLVGAAGLIPLWAVVSAFAVPAAIGVIFGLYPAAKASRLDPDRGLALRVGERGGADSRDMLAAVEPGVLHRVFLVGSAGLCLVLGLVLRAPSFVAFAVVALLLVVLARATARRRLARLGGRRSLTPSAFEGEEVRVEVALENRGRRAGLARRGRRLVRAPRWPTARPSSTPVRSGRGRRHRLAYRTALLASLGRLHGGPAQPLASPISLGLFSPRRVLPDIRPFDVFPQVHPVGGLERLGARTSFAPSEPTTARAGRSAAYLGVRDFRPGDDVRRVHWPATARYARPMVKEFELDLTPYFTLFLDLGRDHRAGTGRKSTLEYVVRTAASLLAAAARRGDTVQLFGEGRARSRCRPDAGSCTSPTLSTGSSACRQDGAAPAARPLPSASRRPCPRARRRPS